ncbi:MAG: cyclic nucleotide-binding domain-containing protein [Nitrospirota bacterium]
MNLSLRAKIIILAIILSTTGLGIMGYLAVQEVSRQVIAQEQEEAFLTVSLLDADVETLEAVLDSRRIQDFINKLVKERPQIVSFTFNGPVYDKVKISGYRTLASSDLNLIWTEIRPEIKKIITADKIVIRTISLNGHSAVEVTAPLHVAGESLAAVNIVTKIESGGNAEAAKERALWVSRVMDANVSTIEALQYPSNMQSMITNLIDANPEITRLSLIGPVYQQAPVLEYRSIAGTDRSTLGALSAQEAITPIVDDRTLVTMDGKENLRVIAPIHVDRKAVAAVDLLFSMDHVRAETEKITNFAIFATLATITLITIFFVTLLNKIIIRPVSKLTDSAKAMAAGNLLQEVKTSSSDELGVLANAFNSMASQIRELIGTLKKRVSELKQTQETLEKQNIELVRTKDALQEAMKNLHTIKITNGVYWLQVPEVDLYILCGCPADVVKLMMKRGLISVTQKFEINFETGPNAILLSDVPIQNGYFSNLAEFPVLQMLYRQGMILPDHPGNTGVKPLLIGTREQVNAQKEYIYRGNYGLNSLEEIMETGIKSDMANEIMKLKAEFAFGKIKSTDELLDTCIVENRPVEVRNGVFVQRKGFNRYEFRFKGESLIIDLNLKTDEAYESPYPMVFHHTKREYFGVIHSGEGDGWDVNRPCMASILMYHGKIFLIDAGPNILYTLRALSIDISEIEGIFHTHAHDDHFAGLPTLLKSDHRLKYYATPLVRASVAKKLSALMSINESEFFQYFDVHDLQFDTWNNLDGLEVKPMFSPHPVETNIFVFRALGEDGYKTYAHLADIISFKVLRNMLAEDKEISGNTQNLYDLVKQNYLYPADIKKVDIGGAFIHGQASDFREDISKEIILAHTSGKLSEEQKEIGSERSFGAIDIFMPATQNYLMKKAAQLLTSYFPDISSELLMPLLNAPMVLFNPGTIIQKKKSETSYIYFVLTGTVEFTSSEFMIQNHLSNGCFIGDVALLKDIPSSGTWRAVSYVQALRFNAGLYSSFLEKYGLYDHIVNILDKIDFLRKTFLFGEGISYPIQNSIAQNMILNTYMESDRIVFEESQQLCLLKSGKLQIKDSREEIIETLKIGDFCGEETFFSDIHDKFIVEAARPSEVYLIKNFPLLEIPVVHWKLLEVSSKRIRMIDSLKDHS